MMKLLIAALSIFPALTQAQTACPTAADLAQGIRVERSGGNTEVFRQAAPGIIAVDGYVEDDLTYRLELAYGLQLLSYEGIDSVDKSVFEFLRYDYGLPIDDLPTVTPAGRWQSDVTVTDNSGSYPQEQRYAYGPLRGIVIGDCQYAMVEVTIAYDTETNYIETVNFMPDLGFGVLVWQSDDEAGPTVFTIDRIGLAAQ